MLSGDICRNLKTDLFHNANIPEVITAVYEHDRSWIQLDSMLKVNPATLTPYSFNDYPLEEKLDFYVQGLNEIEKINSYSGLLCSLHYTSFFDAVSSPESFSFVEKEKQRQEKILHELGHIDQSLIMSHLNILQFCDRLSLYVCLNDPGVPKELEHQWYWVGIRYSEKLNPAGNKPIITRWISKSEVQVIGFPFGDDFESTLRFGRISKEDINSIGIDPEKVAWEEQKIIFRR